MLDVTLVGDGPRVLWLSAEQDMHKGGLTRTIGCDKPDLLPTLDGEGDIREEDAIPEALGELLDLKHT